MHTTHFILRALEERCGRLPLQFAYGDQQVQGSRCGQFGRIKSAAGRQGLDNFTVDWRDLETTHAPVRKVPLPRGNGLDDRQLFVPWITHDAPVGLKHGLHRPLELLDKPSIANQECASHLNRTVSRLRDF